jgi:hypothetical protein
MTGKDIEKICESGLEYLFLVSLVSSDNNMTIDECKKNLENYDSLEAAVKEANISEEKKAEFNKYITKGRNILNQDIERFKENG